MKEKNKNRSNKIKKSTIRILEATVSGIIAGLILELLK